MPADLGASSFELLTSPGPAAIAVLRLQGPAAGEFVRRHVRPRRAAAIEERRAGDLIRADLLEADGTVLDDMLVSVHAAPPAWDLRLHLHGSPALVHVCMDLMAACGLERRAEAARGLWSAADAIEAEAHILLPQMLTAEGAHWVLRQAAGLRAALRELLELESLDEQRRRCGQLAAGVGRVEWFTHAARIALIGPPNAGKSTLANTLADQDVSLVSAEAGTTRDWVDVPGQLRGFPVTWVDTAGLRPTGDAIEMAAVARTHDWLRAADAILVVLDATEAGAPACDAFVEQYSDIRPGGVALNKVDLQAATESLVEHLPAGWRSKCFALSALHRTGLSDLESVLLRSLGRETDALAAPGAFTQRQAANLNLAATASSRTILVGHVERCLYSPITD